MNRRNRAGNTPLLNLATVEKDNQTLPKFRLLLERGADILCRNDEGENCLHIFVDDACFPLLPCLQSLVLLIEAGADPFAIDNDGRSVPDAAYRPSWFDKRYELGPLRGDLFDAALVRCGFDIREMRGRYPRTPQYAEPKFHAWGARKGGYAREDFEELWAGCEHLCPYFHDPPWWPHPPDTESETKFHDVDFSDEDESSNEE